MLKEGANLHFKEVYRRALSNMDIRGDKADDVAGLVVCKECGGSGDWSYGPTPDTCGPCIDCKGTGEVLVSV